MLRLVLLCIGCGALMALPGLEISQAPAWFALAAPLWIICQQPRWKPAALLALAFTLTWTLSALFFVRLTTWPGWFALSLYTSLCYMLAFLAARHLARVNTFAAVFGFASLWTLVELFRARVPVLGFPWLQLGHAVADAPVLSQCADLFGVYGLSFIIASSNAALAFCVWPFLRDRLNVPPSPYPLPQEEREQCHASEARRKVLIGWLSLLLAAQLYGRVRFTELAPQLRPGPRLALIQGCCYSKLDRSSEEKWTQLKEHLQWHALAAVQKPDLICWAETMLPGAYNRDPFVEDFTKVVAHFKIPTLVGSDYIQPEDLKLADLWEQRWYNTAFLVDGSGMLVQQYAKQRLVPFGEYIPWTDTLPFLKALRSVTRDTYRPGTESTAVWKIPEGGDYTYGMNICIEDAHADLTRAAALVGADVLLNLTNDAWFAHTHLLETHLRVARLRAVETRRPLVRVTNSGISCQIDPLGTLELALPPDQPGVGFLTVRILKSDGHARIEPSRYLWWGDTGVLAGLLLILFQPLFCIARQYRSKT